MVVFQPGEETAQGAQAMINDNLPTRFPQPFVVLGQHVMLGAAGDIAGSAGPITSAADSLQIRLFGRGAHGSMPQAAIDPVVMAAATVMRLQTVVSREMAATEAAVVTVGVLQAGTKENVIPEEAIIKLNVRTFDAEVRLRVLAAIERIVNAEAEASGAPRKPEITPLDRYPLNLNDEAASNRIAEAFRAHFSPERVHHTGPAPAARILAVSAQPGMFHQCSGSSAGLTRKLMPKQKRPERLISCRSTIALSLLRRSTRPWKPASRPWLSRPSRGWRHNEL
jgi:hippurate hydrolase